MSNTNTCGPAFPTTQENGCNSGEPGMTLRDYFAGKAMQGLMGLAWAGREPKELFKSRADYAYEMADAMLKAREA